MNVTWNNKLNCWNDLPDGNKLVHNDFSGPDPTCEYCDGEWVLEIPDEGFVSGLGFSSYEDAMAWAERNILPGPV